MWNAQQQPALPPATNLSLVSEELAEEGDANGSSDNMFRHVSLQQHRGNGNGNISNSNSRSGLRTSTSQLSVSRSSSLSVSSRSNSLHTLNPARGGLRRHTVSALSLGDGHPSGRTNNNNTMMNETFRIPYFAHTTNGSDGTSNSNPFAHFMAVGASAPLHVLQQQQHHRQPSAPAPPSFFPRTVSSGGVDGGVQPHHLGLGLGVARAASVPLAEAVPLSEGSLSKTSSSSSSDNMEHAAAPKAKGLLRCIAPSPSPTPVTAKESALRRTNSPPQTGPSLLYRLIARAAPGGRAGRGGRHPVDWDVILQRARSHPQEACFFDPNAGGHVYALHRLLRRGGGGESCGDCDCCDESLSSFTSGGGGEGGLPGSCRRRPPVAVVEAVIQACPRAVTRKQAVIDEDVILMSMGEGIGVLGGGNSASDGNSNNPMEWDAQAQQLQQQQGQLFPIPDGENFLGAENNDAVQDQQPPPNDAGDANNDDVRFEYPLAIACECEQDGEVVRLLASYLSTAQPVYRSEVFRSLDYASLPNPVVRILLEEYAGCVLERGMNSEATEGDDDDCPLEQVLFWWDDPDMMGMEEDIANYPDCNMCEDLCDLWEKLRMMLYAATMGSMDGYDKAKESFQVLHHILRIVSEGGIQDVRFPNDFAHAVLLLAKFIQREKGIMFRERNENGSLPLHIAVSGKELLRADAMNYPSRTEENGRSSERNDGNGPGEDDVQNNGNAAMDDDGHAEANAAQQEQHNVPLLPLPEEQQGAGPGPAAAAAPQAEGGGGGDENQANQADEEDDDDDEEEDGGDDDPNEDVPSDMEIVRLLLAQHPASIRLRDSLSGSLPIHIVLRNNPYAVEAIEYFLDLYPRSVTMPDGDGRLPLHTALIQESPTWEKVLGLSPISLEARDPVTGLLPFQLAAMSKPKKGAVMEEGKAEVVDRGEDLNSLSTTFRLLRRNPCLASGLGDVKPRPLSLIEQQIMCRHTPRVTRLEEENERLRRRVEELECELLLMQIMNSNASGPILKKRKSSCASIH